jgi:hypothetical protein
MKMASILRTVSKAIGEMADVLPRALAAISASSKNLRLACAQQPASVMGPGCRSGL